MFRWLYSNLNCCAFLKSHQVSLNRYLQEPRRQEHALRQGGYGKTVDWPQTGGVPVRPPGRRIDSQQPRSH